MSTLRIAVIGGGISGLAAALRLSKRLPLLGKPAELKLYESSGRLGGALYTRYRDEFVIEGGADSFLAEKRRGVAFCDEVGLRRELVRARQDYRRSFVTRGTQLIPVPQGFYLIAPTKLGPFLASGCLSWKGKFRLLKEPWVPRQGAEEEADPNRDESLGSFVRRRLGQDVLERLAQPLAAGIYAADPDALSLRATFPQFLDMEKAGVLKSLLRAKDPAANQASGARYGLFVSLRGGMETLSHHLRQMLPPEIFQMQTAIRALSIRHEGLNPIWTLIKDDGSTVEADAVCLTLPSYISSFLLRGVDTPLATSLGTIGYSDSMTINLAFKKADIAHPMNGFGFVVPAVEKRFISACTFSHQKFDGRAPRGYALLRAFVGGTTAARFTGDDSELERRVMGDLKDLLGIKGRPLFSVVTRYPKALPQYTVGHLSRLKEIKDRANRIPGLALAGNWMRGVGVPDAIETGEEAADATGSYLSSR